MYDRIILIRANYNKLRYAHTYELKEEGYRRTVEQKISNI